MRLGTLERDGSTTRAAVASADGWSLLDAADVGALAAQPGWRSRAEDALVGPTELVPFEEARLVRPLLRPGKILCCGLNYADHIRETGRDTPQYPTLFAKFADTLTDPHARIDVVGAADVDWEAELAIVVGAPLASAARAEADAAILGYTVANDISMRDWQARTVEWLQGKAFDRTTPLGPVVVTADEFDPARGSEIGARVGHEVVQRSSTDQLVFDGSRLLSYISRFTRLAPGDLVLTGTPGGVGMGRSPRRYLADGEVLTTWIEGIGELRNELRIAPVAAVTT